MLNSQPLGLVVADPHPVMLDGLRAHLEGCPDLALRACVGDGESALQALQWHRPQVLVLDLDLPGRSGLEVIEALHQQRFPTRPVVFTSAPMAQVMRALDLGVRGLVSKQQPHETLVHCIRQVHAGHAWLDQQLSQQTVALLMERQKSRDQAARLLTPREVDVARMVSEGWPNKKIASKLSISEGTAKLHLHHIYQKLNCPGRMALMLYMQRQGLT